MVRCLSVNDLLSEDYYRRSRGNQVFLTTRNCSFSYSQIFTSKNCYPGNNKSRKSVWVSYDDPSMPNTLFVPISGHADEQARPIRRRVASDGRVRSGCLTCKARKKKCDEQVSSLDGRCQACARLGLVCEKRPLQVRTPPKLLSEAKEKKYDTMVISQHPATKVTRNEQILLKYYLERLVFLSSILQQRSNGFCSVLLPMAIADSSLLHALLAYTSIYIDGDTATIPVTSKAAWLNFESKAVSGLSKAITENEVSESTIACALICSTADVIRGDSTRWTWHLHGAGRLVQHLGTQKLLQTTDGIFLLRNFAYHDIMAALSTRRQPLIPGMYWSQDNNLETVDCLMGVAQPILGHLSDLCFLIANTDSLTSDAVDVDAISAQCRAIACALNTEIVDHGSKDHEPLIHHAEAFRYATLIHLYRFLCRFASRGTIVIYEVEMGNCVQEILAHVSQIPPNLYCEIGLLFPLFMAGIAGLDDSDTIEYILGRLEYIASWTKLKHVTKVREILELLMNLGRSDWEVMLDEMNLHISLA